jgi:hypothetical protein
MEKITLGVILVSSGVFSGTLGLAIPAVELKVLGLLLFLGGSSILYSM